MRFLLSFLILLGVSPLSAADLGSLLGGLAAHAIDRELGPRSQSSAPPLSRQGSSRSMIRDMTPPLRRSQSSPSVLQHSDSYRSTQSRPQSSSQRFFERERARERSRQQRQATQTRQQGSYTQHQRTPRTQSGLGNSLMSPQGQMGFGVNRQMGMGMSPGMSQMGMGVNPGMTQMGMGNPYGGYGMNSMHAQIFSIKGGAGYKLTPPSNYRTQLGPLKEVRLTFPVQVKLYNGQVMALNPHEVLHIEDGTLFNPSGQSMGQKGSIVVRQGQAFQQYDNGSLVELTPRPQTMGMYGQGYGQAYGMGMGMTPSPYGQTPYGSMGMGGQYGAYGNTMGGAAGMMASPYGATGAYGNTMGGAAGMMASPYGTAGGYGSTMGGATGMMTSPYGATTGLGSY